MHTHTHTVCIMSVALNKYASKLGVFVTKLHDYLLNYSAGCILTFRPGHTHNAAFYKYISRRLIQNNCTALIWKSI